MEQKFLGINQKNALNFTIQPTLTPPKIPHT